MAEEAPMPVERRLKRLEDYVSQHLYPIMVDVDEALFELNEKCYKLLKLLEKKFKE